MKLDSVLSVQDKAKYVVDRLLGTLAVAQMAPEDLARLEPSNEEYAAIVKELIARYRTATRPSGSYMDR